MDYNQLLIGIAMIMQDRIYDIFIYLCKRVKYVY